MPLHKLPIKTSAGVGLYMLDRAVKEFYASRCTTVQLREIEAYFRKDGEVRCIYCQASNPERWDHLHPVSRGGDTVPGNLVPACQRCDDSKQDLEVDEWAQGGRTHSPSFAALQGMQGAVLAYRNQFPYDPIEFDSKLTPAQRSIYDAFRVELANLRAHLQSAGLLKK